MYVWILFFKEPKVNQLISILSFSSCDDDFFSKIGTYDII